MRKAGWPITLSRGFPKSKPSHQCGTNRMGADPQTSVVDPNLKAHDLDNLYICDASVLPTSAAVNPSLTIAALALRAGDHIAKALHDPARPHHRRPAGHRPWHRPGPCHPRLPPRHRLPLPPEGTPPQTLCNPSPEARYYQHDLWPTLAAIPALLDRIEMPKALRRPDPERRRCCQGPRRHAGPDPGKLRLDHRDQPARQPSSWLTGSRPTDAGHARPALPLHHLRHLRLGPAGQPRARRLLHLQGRRAMAAQTLALRLAPHGIGVFELRPGIIATGMTAGVKDKYDRPHRRTAWSRQAAGASPPTSARPLSPSSPARWPSPPAR
jgi:hypothetical protein